MKKELPQGRVNGFMLRESELYEVFYFCGHRIPVAIVRLEETAQQLVAHLDHLHGPRRKYSYWKLIVSTDGIPIPGDDFIPPDAPVYTEWNPADFKGPEPAETKVQIWNGERFVDER